MNGHVRVLGPRLMAVASVIAVAASAACGTSTSGGSASSAAAGAATSTPSSSSSVAASASSGSSGSGKLKVAFLLNGAIDNHGWDTAMYNGIEALKSQLGDKIDLTYKASLPDGPQVKPVLQSLIASGTKLIFTTSFGEQTYVMPLAAAHPDVKFVQVEALKLAPNVAGFQDVSPEGFYIGGMVAAAASKKPLLGVVGGFPLVTEIAKTNGFLLGAQKIKPDAKVQVVWTNDWDSLPKAQSAAQGLVSSGAGALTELTTGPGIAPVAASQDIPWLGYEADQKSFAPKTYLGGVLQNWAPYFIAQTKDMLAGTWKSGSYFATVQNGGVSFAPWGSAYDSLDPAVKAKIQQAVTDLKSGKLHPFTGPFKDRDGKAMVAAGKVMTPAEIAFMGYPLPGVLGTIPKS